MKRSSLPQVYELLGRIYTEREWEALCNGCGKCCYEATEVDGKWVRSSIPCKYLDDFDASCRVYSNRFQAEKNCMKVTPSAILLGRLPEDCTYVTEMNRIADEDYESGHRGGRGRGRSGRSRPQSQGSKRRR